MPTIAIFMLVAIVIITAAFNIYEGCAAIREIRDCNDEKHKLATREIKLSMKENELSLREEELEKREKKLKSKGK